jgi:hypothetical protein
MADFYTTEQLSIELGLNEVQITELVANSVLQPATKNGLQFYSAREVYRLRAAVKLARKRKITLEEAMTQLSARPLYQVDGSLV